MLVAKISKLNKIKKLEQKNADKKVKLKKKHQRKYHFNLKLGLHLERGKADLPRHL